MFAQKDGKSSRERLVTAVFIGALAAIITLIVLRFVGLISPTESILGGLVVVVVFLVIRLVDLRINRTKRSEKI
jgi:cadmium resistance protein CadD (predicted permease)